MSDAHDRLAGLDPDRLQQLAGPDPSRTVDGTGLVWQQGRHGTKVVGEVHRTRAGRYYVVIAGRRIAERLPTFDAARAAALAYVPEPADAEVLAAILDPTRRPQ